VIGGGWIGLEVTAAARQAGLQVTVLEISNCRYDQVVVRGDVDGREFIAFWLKDGRVLAA
jgi:pyruvate/2-oxoglutarate dehydrogenase complex dihydrolipoamide dehydrogenase (E3) component